MDTGYIWAEDKYELTKAKHDVTFSEVVAAMEDPHAVEMQEEVFAASVFEIRTRLVGCTSEGRMLLVVHTDEDAPLFRIVTAFDAPQEWIHEYQTY